MKFKSPLLSGKRRMVFFFFFSISNYVLLCSMKSGFAHISAPFFVLCDIISFWQISFYLFIYYIYFSSRFFRSAIEQIFNFLIFILFLGSFFYFFSFSINGFNSLLCRCLIKRINLNHSCVKNFQQSFYV